MGQGDALVSFLGSFDHTVDPKGRVVVPAQYRDDFRDGGHLSLRRDHIALYGPAGWEQFMDKLRSLLAEREITRPEFNQLMAASAFVTPDSQGRFGLPPKLREMARIGDKATFVGADDYLAIHATETAPVPEADSFASLMDTFDGLPL
jgi:MraZ protein